MESDKIIYISNTRLPSEKANSYQSMMMCEAFKKYFDGLEFWYPDRGDNIRSTSSADGVFNYYDVNYKFTLKKLKTIDSQIAYKISHKLWARIHKIFFTINCVLSLLKENRKAIIYTRDVYVLRALSILKRIKVLNNTVYFEAHEYFKKLVSYMPHISGVIVINKHLKDRYILADNSLNNILVCHDGVKVETFKQYDMSTSKYELDLLKDVNYITYIGRLNTMGNEKGVDDLLSSLDRLNNNNMILMIVGGEKSDIKKYQSLAEKNNISDKVVFIERQPVSELYKYLAASSVLLMPFPWTEHYAYNMSPLKMFEYMASNRVIVASDLPSIKEVLTHNVNAILYKTDDLHDLSAKIDWALSNDTKQLSLQAYKDVKCFTWSERAKNIVEYIKDNDSICVE